MLKKPAIVLGLLLFSIYLLTGSGHTYSPDEESIIYVNQSFVTRGDFNIPNPNGYPVVGGHRGIGGKIYSGTGIGSSLASLPLYVLADQLAGAFPSSMHALFLRLFLVLLFNSLVSALTGILLYAWLRKLGASVRASTALVLVYALATLTWVYARTFYAEPLLTLCFVLGAYSIRMFHDTRSNRWMLVSGLAAGFAILTKLQGLLVLPALAVYYFALELPPLVANWRNSRRFPARFWPSFFFPGFLFVLGLSLGLGLFGYTNWLRFGDVLQTGRGDVAGGSPMLRGLYGLLLSSGKSVFLYVPPLVLALVAFPRFIRRWMAEGLFCITLIVIFVVFHSRLAIWSGDGAWGPRYMVSLMPFWLLPLAAVIHDWWQGRVRRAVLVAFVGAGILVNLLGLTVNFDSYIQIQPADSLRQFNPPDSPLLGQWRVLSGRVDAWWTGLVTAKNAVVPIRGFLATGSDEIFPRYLAPRASIVVKSELAQPMQMALVAYDYRPDAKPKRQLTFLSNGVPLQSQRLPTNDSGILSYRVQIPRELAGWAPIDIVTLGSEPTGKSPQGDELGLHLQSLGAQAGDDELAMPRYVAISPAPVADPKQTWGWFFAPDLPQFDFYWWYLYFSGLDDLKVVTTVAIVSVIGLAGLIPGVRGLCNLLFGGKKS